MLNKDVRANHVTQRMVLLQDLESGGIGDFGVFCDLEAVVQPSSIYFGNERGRNARLLAVFKDKELKTVWRVHYYYSLRKHCG